MENLKYGDVANYKYNLPSEQMNFLTAATNRSVAQTLFLYQLVDGDFEKLKLLEEQTKNCFVAYCPDNKQQVAEIMQKEPKNKWFKI